MTAWLKAWRFERDADADPGEIAYRRGRVRVTLHSGDAHVVLFPPGEDDRSLDFESTQWQAALSGWVPNALVIQVVLYALNQEAVEDTAR